MQIVSTEAMRLMDKMAIQEIGMPSILLMEHAAEAVATYIKNNYAKDQNIMIVCGPGNNGGDGFALARLLVDKGFIKVRIHCKVEKTAMSQDACVMAMLAEKNDIPIVSTTNLVTIAHELEMSDLLVDAIFGTGLSRNIEGFYSTIINLMNQSKKPILSIDIASGLHGDSGSIMGCAIMAKETITFECLKKGQVQNDGKVHSGTIIPVTIAMPQVARDTHGKGITLLDEAFVKTTLPARGDFTHKGSFGKGLMVGGSEQMHGALSLCAQAALKSGIGTLTVFVPESIREVLSKVNDECMIITAPQEKGFFSKAAGILLKEILPSYDFVTIGNGMGRGEGAKELVKLVLESDIPCILDGDALFLAGTHRTLLEKRKAITILTPHPKELSYLSEKTIQALQTDIFTSTMDFTKACQNVTLVAKDSYTIITDGTTSYLNTHGNNALAKGGSGDVLCGIITGLFGQSKDAVKSCICGVYVHAIAAEHKMMKEDANSILPTDIIEGLSFLFKSLR